MSTGFELGEERYEAALAATHLLSQSWAVSEWENGVAYMARRDDEFLREGLLKMCSTELDVYLLVALDRLRVRAISKNLAETARKLRSARPGADEPVETVMTRLDGLIDEALVHDSDAVAFLTPSGGRTSPAASRLT